MSKQAKKVDQDALQDTGERLIPDLHKDSITYGEHIGRYRSIEGAIKGKIVLDIACGTGYGSQLMATGAKKVYGVDISEEAVTYAQANYSTPNVDFLVGDGRKIPLDDQSVDVVVSMETIEHIEDQETFLKEVQRVLKPGGNLFVSTPNDKEYPKGNHFHVREHSNKTLKTLLEKYFKNTTFYYQTDEVASTIIAEHRLGSGFEVNQWNLVKNLPLTPDRCIYFLASCSDLKPLPIDENTILAEFFSHHEIANRGQREQWFNEHTQELERYTKELEQELSTRRDEIKDLRNSRLFRLGRYYRVVRDKSKPNKGR